METEYVDVYMAQNLIFDGTTSDDFELKFTRATYKELGLYSINFIKDSHMDLWIIIGVVLCVCTLVVCYCCREICGKYREAHGKKKFYQDDENYF